MKVLKLVLIVILMSNFYGKTQEIADSIKSADLVNLAYEARMDEIFENIEATVKNVAGQVVNSISFFNVNSFNFDINSSSGIYFLTLKTNTGKSTTLKLIKL